MRKIYKSVVVFVLGLITQQTQAQVGIGTTTPNNHSILELSATDKGLLVPRLSQVERNAMSLGVAEKGMMIFNTSFTRFEFWDGATWVAVGVPADNLGNHIVGQNIQLGPYYLSNNAMSEGLRIGSGGVANISTSTLPVASPLLTLYTSVSGVSMKMKPNALSVLGSTLNFDTESDQPIYFKTGGTTDMTLDASGNLGIGNPLPAYKLDVNGDINIASTGKLRVGGTAGTTGQVLGINASGNMQWATPSGGADNLGNHTASQNLDLNGYNVTSSGSITFNVAGTDLLNLNSSTFAISSMAGQFRGIAGSISTPSFTFATNANTGLYNPSVGQMAVTLNGVESTRFTGTGVGIGTISPTQRLQVVGNVLLSNAGTASELRLAEPSASGNNYTALRATAQTADITYTFPDVAPTTGQVLSSDASGNMSWITAGGSGNVTVASGSANYIPKWTTANTLSNTSSIFDNGNVGIGTNAPLGKLHVLGDSYFTSSSGFYFTQNTSIGNGYFTMIYNPDVLGSGAPTQTFQFTPRNNANTGTVPTAEYTMGKYASALGGYHAFSTRNSSNVLAERVRIDSDGNVGIGTNSPTATLDVNGDAILAGDLDMDYNYIVNVADPTDPSDAANKSYVDDNTIVNQYSLNQSADFRIGGDAGIGTSLSIGKDNAALASNPHRLEIWDNSAGLGAGYATLHVYARTNDKGAAIMGVANQTGTDDLGSGHWATGALGAFEYNGLSGDASDIGVYGWTGDWGNTWGGLFAFGGTGLSDATSFVGLAGKNNVAATFVGGRVGIGTSTPTALLSVGTSGNGFQVNNTGNIVSLNGVTTNFPSANASGVLTNDGTGTLTWAASTAVTASNGLTATGTNIQLGGTLANATTINQSTNNLFFTNGNIGVGSGNINMMSADRALTVSAVAIGVENKNAALDLVGNAGSYNSNTAAINFVGIQPITNIVARRAMISALSGSSATANGQLAFYTYNGTLNEVMRLTEGRRVAIGTTTPTARLEVVENVAGSFLDTLSKISHIGSSTWSAHRVALNVETKGSWSGGNSTALNVRVGGSVINYAALFNGGNVGIGTVAPAQLLSVGGTSGFQVNNDGNIVKINGATTNFPLANSAGALSNDGAGNLTWQPLLPLNGLSMSGANPVLGGTLTMNTTITQASYNLSFMGGKVGVGTTAPTSPLTVNGSVAFPIKTAPNGAYTFADTDFTVIRAVGNTGAFTLPAASTCSGRIYTVVNQSAAAITISSYLGLNGSGSTTVAATSSVMLQSNGTNWYQIK